MSVEDGQIGFGRVAPVRQSLIVSAALVLSSVFAATLGALVFANLHLPLGTTVIVVACVTLALIFTVAFRDLGDHRHARFGPANLVTAIRAALVSLIGAVVFFSDDIGDAGVLDWSLAAVSTIALVLDGIDGFLARHYRQESDFGARFDMEVDALLILILSAAAFILGKAGLWVLAIGMMRYLFVWAAWFDPRLSGELPPSFRRKLVCVVQVVALSLMLVPVITPPVTTLIALTALLALVYSFAVDVRYLVGHPVPSELDPDAATVPDRL